MNPRTVSDEVYQFLHFGKDFPTSLFEFDDPSSPCVFAINSFSKLIGPGMRLGWVATHQQQMSVLLSSGPLQSGGGFNPFTGAIFSELLKSGFLNNQVVRLREYYSAMCGVMCNAIDRYLCPAVEEHERVQYYRPTGGFFCFVTFPERYDTQQLLEFAQSCGVSYFVGRNSSPDKTLFKSSIRICFAFVGKDAIEEGVKRLGTAVAQYREKCLTTLAREDDN